MHPDDKFMPTPVEWFMDRSELWLSSLEEERRLLGRGEVTGIGIAAHQRSLEEGQQLQLRLDPEAKCGPPEDEIDDTPLYANVKHVVGRGGRIEAIEINYLTFYAHNGWYDIGYMGLLRVGAHDGDWEHLTVRLSASGELQGVYFNAHRSRDGCWVSADKLERRSDGRLKAYVARHGHGTYPKAGLWWRAGLMANDFTSDQGAVWCPKLCYVLPVPRTAADQSAEAARVVDSSGLVQPERFPSDERTAVASVRGVTSQGQNLQQSNDTPQTLRSGRDSIGADQEGKADVTAAPMVNRIGRGVVGVQEARCILQAPSRGTRLLQNAPSTLPQFSGEGVEVLDHSGEWLDFLGQWGTTPSPADQSWFWTAEPPVSRGVLLRIVGHLWPERMSV